MTTERNNDPILTLSEIHTSEELARWVETHVIDSNLIDEVMAAVRRFLDKGDFAAAGRLANWGVVLVKSFEDGVMTARALVTQGIVFARSSEHRKALDCFDEALRLYDAAGDELSAAKVRMNRIMCYSHTSRYDEALAEAERNNEVLSRLGEKQLLARNLNNLGEVLFRLDRFQEWLATLDRSESLLREIGDHKSLAMVYGNHAVAFTSLNVAPEAFRYYHLAIQLAKETGQTFLAACTTYNLGYLHYMQGEYTRALAILNETREALATDDWYVPLCDLTQSEIYLEMNMHREAIRFATAAYDRFALTQKPFEMAKAVGVMAMAHSRLYEFAEADKLFQQARTMFHTQRNAVRAAGIDLYRAMMWLHLGRHAETKTAAEHAYEIFLAEDIKPKAAFARIIAAHAKLRSSDAAGAGQDAGIAAALYEQSPAPWIGQQLYALKGQIYWTQEQPAAARDQFLRAIVELEAVRANIAMDDLRLNYLKDKVPVYEMLMAADFKLGDPASLREAFTTSERARSRTLVELLAGSVDSLREITSASAEEIQGSLPDGTALIEYCFTGDAVSAFVLSAGKFEVVRDLCPSKSAKQAFDYVQFHFSRLITNPSVLQRRAGIALHNIQEHLQELYRLLVRPLETLVNGCESLIFVPFDFLHYVPFHALYDGSAYLADRYTISYAPTATIYRMFVSKTARDGGAPLLIGVPDTRAPFIREEIESIRSVAPDAQTCIGPDATRERVQRAMTEARLIHIASHASFNPDNPMFSSIKLHDAELTFFDIYNLRTRADLITLSGCGTGLSGVVAGDELLGLVRGFLYAGATAVVISLWDVNDRTTARLMQYFYGHMAEGTSKSQSLQLAMMRLREDHPHPYYWAPFLLMGSPR